MTVKRCSCYRELGKVSYIRLEASSKGQLLLSVESTQSSRIEACEPGLKLSRVTIKIRDIPEARFGSFI